MIDLRPCKMMVFQGEPYDDEKFEEAIDEIWEVMKRYNPRLYGFDWADEEAPRFQLAPQGYRGISKQDLLPFLSKMITDSQTNHYKIVYDDINRK